MNPVENPLSVAFRKLIATIKIARIGNIRVIVITDVRLSDNFFTTHKRSYGKVMFYSCLSIHGGLASQHASLVT